jgi:hypothetical protein
MYMLVGTFSSTKKPHRVTDIFLGSGGAVPGWRSEKSGDREDQPNRGEGDTGKAAGAWIVTRWCMKRKV